MLDSTPLLLPCCSVTYNGITGEGAERLSKVILDMPLMADFGGIPIKALRDNSMRDLDRSDTGLGIPETTVLSGLLAGASSLTTLK